MTIKIPKTAIFPIVIIALLGGFFWLTKTPTTERSSDTVDLPVREIDLTAKQFEFSPNPIRVKLDEVVILNITSTDVTHGFSLPAFGIDQALPAGETVTVQFQAIRRGEFPFACSVACGVGHPDMRGSLIVE